MPETGARQRFYRPRHRAGRNRPKAGTVLGSVLLGATVFVLATLAGGLLAGAAPASLAADLMGREGSVAPSPEPAPAASAEDEVDPRFGQSMVISGVTGLTISIVGMVIVARRRRLW